LKVTKQKTNVTFFSSILNTIDIACVTNGFAANFANGFQPQPQNVETPKTAKTFDCVIV
jgi:hypothetical protein